MLTWTNAWYVSEIHRPPEQPAVFSVVRTDLPKGKYPQSAQLEKIWSVVQILHPDVFRDFLNRLKVPKDKKKAVSAVRSLRAGFERSKVNNSPYPNAV